MRFISPMSLQMWFEERKARAIVDLRREYRPRIQAAKTRVERRAIKRERKLAISLAIVRFTREFREHQSAYNLY